MNSRKSVDRSFSSPVVPAIQEEQRETTLCPRRSPTASPRKDTTVGLTSVVERVERRQGLDRLLVNKVVEGVLNRQFDRPLEQPARLFAVFVIIESQ